MQSLGRGLNQRRAKAFVGWLLGAALFAGCGDDSSAPPDSGDMATADRGSGPCATLRAGDVCRESASPCDLEERCDGVSAECPADARAANGAPCTRVDGDERIFGVCRAGMCEPECNPGATCTRGVPCEVGVLECDGASECVVDDELSRTQCGDRCIDLERDALNCGRCDSPCGPGEACVRGECSSEGVCAGQAAGTLCRAAASLCDVEEVCDGVSPDCPPDDLAPARTTCRAVAGPCDQREICTGLENSCPPDAVRPAGSECMDDDGNAGFCAGDARCPPEVCVPGGTCNTGNPCEMGMIECNDEGEEVCMAVAQEPDGTMCGDTTNGPFSDCVFEETCSETGTQTRTVTARECNAGVCMDVESMEMQTCTQVTEGNSCGDVVMDDFGECMFATECAEMGTRTRMVMTPLCAAGACETQTTTESEDCTQVTEGNPCDTDTGTCMAGACVPN